MIVKVIPNTIDTPVAQRVYGLSDYIHDPKPNRTNNLVDYIHGENTESDLNISSEKCVYSNSRNFLDDDSVYQKIEMSQTASLNSRVIGPIEHIVGSFKKFEVPTIEQLEQQIDILVKHLGAEELQMQYAMHLDTDNAHFHLIINKVHPFKKNKHNENKVIDLGDGWMINALHRAAAEIEAKQGWQPEPNPLFIFNPHTQQCEKNPSYLKQTDLEKLDAKIRDQEHKHQQKSNIRDEISAGKGYQPTLERIISQVLLKVKSWQEWHTELAEVGLSYESKRNGAIFNFDIIPEPVSFKSSVFCQKTATIKSLEKMWGPFQSATSDTIPILILNPQWTQQPPSKNDQIHPYHLFNHDDYLLQELHTSYLQLKTQKDQITSQNKEESAEIHFNHAYYQHYKAKFLADLKKKFPQVDEQSIKTLLHYKQASDQNKYKKERRTGYSEKHKNLSQKISEKLKQRFDFNPRIRSEKMTSYDDFLQLFDQENTYLIQQKFLLDQRQSPHFLWQENLECTEAKIIFDEHQKQEPIAIQNKFGIQVFSNYSFNRINQCVKHLDINRPIKIAGDQNFLQLGKWTLETPNIESEDNNKRRVTPNLRSFPASDLELMFEKIYSQSKDSYPISTTLLKASLLLNCCHVDLKTLKNNLKNFIERHPSLKLSPIDQKNLQLRLQYLVLTQSKKLNKKYYYSEEIDYVWELYLKLNAKILKNEKNESSRVENPILELELVPILPKASTYNRSEYSVNPYELTDYEQSRLLQHFADLRKNRQEANQLKSAAYVDDWVNFTQTKFINQRYTIEHKFGDKFYIDRKKTAFIEAKDSTHITVMSEQNIHICDALFLAKEKYGKVYVSGSENFKSQVKLIAEEYNIPIVLEQESNQVVIQQDSPPLPLHKTPAFSLEERDPSLPTAEERAQDLYDNQTVSYTMKKKEELPSQDNDLNYGL